MPSTFESRPSLTADRAIDHPRPGTPWIIGIVVGVLMMIVFAFAGRRLWVDVPNLTAGTQPDQAFDARYVSHPWLTYLHIGPGTIYLLGAVLQLSFWFRRRHYPTHRRLGRVVLAVGLLGGATAITLGLVMPFGGQAERWATILFGAWYLASLVLAFRAIRAGDAVQHRRWMIRAFAVGVGVGTIRIWMFLLQVVTQIDLAGAFGPAFWIAFTLHVLVAELWLRRRPVPPDA